MRTQSPLFALLLTALFFFSCEVPLQDISGLELPAPREGEQTVTYKGYVCSYNTKTLIPDWVAYELTADETFGTATREDKSFGMDFSFRGKQARREDYTRSGWTKGHMAPAADFMWDDGAMAETFYFLNICPQREELNNKDWQYLEKQVRRWAEDYDRVWVVSGPIIGENKYGTIGDDHVVVPDAFYKAVLIHDGVRYHAIGFIMGNDAERYYLADCAVSIDDLEALTGLDFFPSLSDDIEDRVEAGYTLAPWSIRKR